MKILNEIEKIIREDKQLSEEEVQQLIAYETNNYMKEG